MNHYDSFPLQLGRILMVFNGPLFFFRVFRVYHASWKLGPKLIIIHRMVSLYICYIWYNCHIDNEKSSLTTMISRFIFFCLRFRRSSHLWPYLLFLSLPMESRIKLLKIHTETWHGKILVPYFMTSLYYPTGKCTENCKLKRKDLKNQNEAKNHPFFFYLCQIYPTTKRLHLFIGYKSSNPCSTERWNVVLFQTTLIL